MVAGWRARRCRCRLFCCSAIGNGIWPQPLAVSPLPFPLTVELPIRRVVPSPVVKTPPVSLLIKALRSTITRTGAVTAETGQAAMPGLVLPEETLSRTVAVTVPVVPLPSNAMAMAEPFFTRTRSSLTRALALPVGTTPDATPVAVRNHRIRNEEFAGPGSRRKSNAVVSFADHAVLDVQGRAGEEMDAVIGCAAQIDGHPRSETTAPAPACTMMPAPPAPVLMTASTPPRQC